VLECSGTLLGGAGTIADDEEPDPDITISIKYTIRKHRLDLGGIMATAVSGHVFFGGFASQRLEKQ
jgi:hypothetical protein